MESPEQCSEQRRGSARPQRRGGLDEFGDEHAALTPPGDRLWVGAALGRKAGALERAEQSGLGLDVGERPRRREHPRDPGRPVAPGHAMDVGVEPIDRCHLDAVALAEVLRDARPGGGVPLGRGHGHGVWRGLGAVQRRERVLCP